jgi:oligopeptide transport system permease protein
MLTFIVKRLGSGLITLWTIFTLTFFLVRTLPGGPFDDQKQFPPEIKARLEQRFHLNAPLTTQYLNFLGNLIKGDLGPSLKSPSRNVQNIIGESYQISALLGGLALLLGISLGIFSAVFSCLSPWPYVKQILNGLGWWLLSLPTFIAGGLLIFIFAMQLHWLPVATLASPWHAVLPVVTLSLSPFAITFHLLRDQLQAVQEQLYVRVKESYGLPRSMIVIKHVLRQAILPLVSLLGPLFAAVLTGSFAVETIFSIPGLGRHYVFSVLNRDYGLVIGVTLIYAVLLIVLNLVAECVLMLLDPRLKLERSSRSI